MSVDTERIAVRLAALNMGLEVSGRIAGDHPLEQRPGPTIFTPNQYGSTPADQRLSLAVDAADWLLDNA